MQIKATKVYFFILTILAEIKKSNNSNYRQNIGTLIILIYQK